MSHPPFSKLVIYTRSGSPVCPCRYSLLLWPSDGHHLRPYTNCCSIKLSISIKQKCLIRLFDVDLAATNAMNSSVVVFYLWKDWASLDSIFNYMFQTLANVEDRLQLIIIIHSRGFDARAFQANDHLCQTAVCDNHLNCRWFSSKSVHAKSA